MATSSSTSTSMSTQPLPKKSFVDYLQDVAGESHDYNDEDDDDDDDDDGELRPLDTSEDNRSRSQRKRSTPRSGMISPQLTEARSFVNGLLSPFSPLLRHRDQRDEYLEFLSLQPCRKVSVVVRVLPCDDSGQRCLFPHVKSDNATRKPKSPHDMVVVKPSAFGKVIPSQFTMETARLVAQVAHISSEDWARLYEFHHVMWPDQGQEKTADQFSTMDSLSRAVAQDALVERQSSLLISTGQAPACVDPTQNDVCLFSKVIKYCQALMEPKAMATISMVELRDEKDAFQDLINPKNKQVYLRHVDMKGAVLEGLTQVPLDDIKDIWQTIQSKQTHAILATISIWDNAVAQQLKRSPDSQITCVELTRATDLNTPQSKIRNTSSTVSLGLALRQLSLHSSIESDPAISYRESNITKVLQRALESSKIVLLASVSQLSQDYETTLATLNFLRSLLVKPGKTVSSPFHSTQQSKENDVVKNNMANQLQQYSKDESWLENIVADPRQRLAKVFKQSPSQAKQHIPIESAPSEEYNPVDYMQGLDLNNDAWQSPAPPRQEIREPHTSTRRQQPRALNEEPKEMWSIEDPVDDLSPPNQPSSGFIASSEEGDTSLLKRFQHDQQLFDDPQQEDNFSFGIGRTDVSLDISEQEHQSISNDEEYIKDDWSLQDEQSEIEMNVVDEDHENYVFTAMDTQPDQVDTLGGNHSISEEIIFTKETESDSLEQVMEEPKMWSELQSENYQNSRSTEYFSSLYDFPDDSVPMLPDESHHESHDDESLISRSETSLSFTEGKGRMTAYELEQKDVDKEPSTSYSPKIWEETPFNRRSAFQSVSPSKVSKNSISSFGKVESRKSSSLDTWKKTKDDQYIGEIEVLEGAVQQIQNMQSGLWRSSAESLAKLKDALSSQRNEMVLLNRDREALANNVAALKDEIEKNAGEHDARLQRYEEEVEQLKAQLHIANSEKKSLGQAVDKAIIVESELTTALGKLEKDLAAAKGNIFTANESYTILLGNHNKLEAEMRIAQAELRDLKREKEATDRSCAKLECALANSKRDNDALMHEVRFKDSKILDLTEKLSQREKNLQELEERTYQLESSKRQEMLEIEQMKISHKSLSSLLEEQKEEISALEGGRRKDKARIEQLQSELEERKFFQENLLTEKQHMKSQIKDIEQRLELTEVEATTRESLISHLKDKYQYLENSLAKSMSDKVDSEDQCTKLRRVVDKLEEEVRTWKKAKQLGDGKIQQMEDMLRNEESTKFDNSRLREKYMQSERERKELESLLRQSKSEYYDEAHRKTKMLEHLENRTQELEQESKMIKQRELEMAATKDAELSRLRGELHECTGKLETSNAKVFSLELQVRASEERLTGMSEKLEKYRERLIRTEYDLQESRVREETSTTNSSLHVESLNRRIKELENDISKLIQEREKSSMISQEKLSTSRILSHELERARQDLLTARSDLTRQKQQLEERETENRSKERQLSTMKVLIQELQSTIRERFHILSHDSNKTIDALLEQKASLEATLLKTEKQRDACFQCLEYGRNKLARFLHVDFKDELLEEQIFGALQESPNILDHSSPPLSSELYLLDCSIGQICASRAEEIATCLAVSAKTSLKVSQDENLKLRSRIFSIEEEKQQAVAALQERIKFLEGEMIGRSVFASLNRNQLA